MQRVDLAPVPRIVTTAAWFYTLRRTVIAATILGAVCLAGVMVLFAWAKS